MLLYLVNFIHTFFPVSLITGMLISVWTPVYGRKALRSSLISLAAGLPAGIIVYLISFRQETLTSARTCLFATAALAALINAAIIIPPGKRYPFTGLGAALFFTAALTATAAFSFLALLTEQALSAISVLNSDMILNAGGILTGACLIAFFIPLTAHISAKNGRGLITGFLLFASGLLIIQWSAEVLLGLMRLEMAEVTSLRLSFVAKVSKYSGFMPYIQVFILSVLSLVFFVRRTVLSSHALSGLQNAERRKAHSSALLEMRWFKAAAASVCIILSVLLYYDLYALRPPKISPPVRLMPDSGGLIKVKMEEVKDGKLHRYSYVTDDGHAVRFFMISRSTGHDKIGVVYDACMLCGDMGYIQEKNEIICIACNVRIFVPSIGKAGGCNPIPLAYKIEGEFIVITAEDLDLGARYFSEVVSIKVKDPVTGKELTNLKAPFRYEYKGRTYFFESEKSEEKFRLSPEIYAGDRQSRYFRTQGYQGT